MYHERFGWYPFHALAFSVSGSPRLKIVGTLAFIIGFISLFGLQRSLQNERCKV